MATSIRSSIITMCILATLLSNTECQLTPDRFRNMILGGNDPGPDITVDRLHAQIQDLQATVLALKAELHVIRTGSTALPEAEKRTPTIEKLSQPEYSGDNTLTEKSLRDGEIGFHVNLKKSFTLTYGDKIVFDTMKTNFGGAFDMQTGTFICPVSGTYLFSVNLVCDQYSFMHAAIYRNGQKAFTILCDNRNGITWNQGGGTVILKVNKNDKVYVGMFWPYNNISKAYGNGMTSFTGYLMHRR